MTSAQIRPHTAGPRIGSWRPARQLPDLAPGSVHVWRVALDAAGGSEHLFALLSPDERDRAARFHAESDRRRFVVARGVLRELLGRYCAAPPAALRFAAGQHGKPHLVEPASSPHFNLSHSAELALLAVATGPVGVDLEWQDATLDHRELARHCFSVTEQQALASAAGPEGVSRAFFAGWCRKEAYIKATGHGVMRGLDHFDVTLGAGAAAALLDDRLEPDAPERWAMVELSPGAGFGGALVAERPLRSVELLDYSAS